MYGIMYNALSDMIVKGFGEDKWQQVMREADIELGGGSFLIHRHYKDDIMTRLLNSAAKILGLPYDELVEKYGVHFFKHCLECGYERLLRVLGRNLHDFLCNLDALHDHLASIYPGMRAPSFRCYLGDDGSMTLRYYSDRKGLERMVSGIIKSVAQEFFDTKVSVTLASRKGKRQDYTVFHVKEDNFTTILVRKRSNSLVSILHRAKSSTNPRDLPLSVSSFCKAFPFHLVIDRHFQIVQAGAALCRVLLTYRKRTKKLMFHKVFQVVRPVLNNLEFDTFLDHINTVFITVTKPGVIDHSRSGGGGGSISGGSASSECKNASSGNVSSSNSSISSNKKTCPGQGSSSSTSSTSSQVLRLKGQMVFVPETDTLLYLCSPRVTDVDELRERGLYLSDIPIHDATRDLILITQARRAERELVETLEETSNNLKKLQSKLREDKGRTDELLNSLLPSAIAERLRLNQAVEAEKYHLVSILFSDIVGFTAMCSNEHVVPMDIVRLLNRLYTHFDVLSNIHDVYKVETIGDAYMVVGGMPEFTESHADKVTSMAFDMLDVSQTVYSPVQSSPIQVRIGIHSGPCVAGVVGQKMPRYCLFGQTVEVASSMENSSLPGKVNISHTARGYLTNVSQYEFEENTTRGDLPTECSFITPKHNLRRSVPMDLGVPLPRGMFRTPNPSPTNSRGASPVDGASPISSPVRLNSPEGTMTKFKMPAIRICDADEEDFRSSLQAKVNQVAESMGATSTAVTSGEPSATSDSADASLAALPHRSDHQEGQEPERSSGNTACTMSYREYLFGEATESPKTTTTPAVTTTPPPAVTTTVMTRMPSPEEETKSAIEKESSSSGGGNALFTTDVGFRRHSHQPMSSREDPVTMLDAAQLLNKSVTLSDMTDPQAAHIMVVSLESPSSTSVSEASDSVSTSRRPSEATTSGSPPSWQCSPPEEEVRGRWCVPCGSSAASPSADKTYVMASDPVAHKGADGRNSVDSTQQGSVELLDPKHGNLISRRRSDPMKHIDLTGVVDINIPPMKQGHARASSSLRSPSSPRLSRNTGALNTIPSGVVGSGQQQSQQRKTSGEAVEAADALANHLNNGNVKKEMTPSAHRAELRHATDRQSRKSAHDRVAHNLTTHPREACAASSSPLTRPRTAHASASDASSSSRRDKTQRHRQQSSVSKANQEKLSTADLKRIRENGRLVIYFKGRPRSMSPSLRLHPLTVPEGSRSLHDSPFSSPMLTQKLTHLQGDKSKSGQQDTFFRHVRLTRRDLNV